MIPPFHHDDEALVGKDQKQHNRVQQTTLPNSYVSDN